MDSLALLQQWHLQQCDEDWEHPYGVRVETLDNPGWNLDIDLADTELEGKPFEPVHYGMFEEAETSGNEWVFCKVEDNKFSAAGGPLKLTRSSMYFCGGLELRPNNRPSRRRYVHPLTQSLAA